MRIARFRFLWIRLTRKSEIPPPSPTDGFPGVIITEALIFVSCKVSYSPTSLLALFRLPMGLLMAQRLLRKEGGRWRRQRPILIGWGKEGRRGKKRGKEAWIRAQIRFFALRCIALRNCWKLNKPCIKGKSTFDVVQIVDSLLSLPLPPTTAAGLIFQKIFASPPPLFPTWGKRESEKKMRCCAKISIKSHEKEERRRL